MSKKLLNIILLVSLLSTGMLSFPQKVSAADFVIQIERIYQADEDGDVLHITERRKVSNYSNNYFIPASSTETFTIQNFKEGMDEDEQNIKYDSISVTNGYGNSLYYGKEVDEEDIIVTVNYPSAIRKNQSITFSLEYDTNELIEKVGKVKNVYIPGFSSDFEEYVTDKETGTVSQITYSTKLIIPNTLGKESFTLPEPSGKTVSSESISYTFDTEQLIEKSVWHQIGTEQFYHFKITQPSQQTDFFTPEQLDFISKNQYKIILPRDYSETNQQVFFTSITPTPETVKIDNDGNVIASFLTNATKNEDITVEGYITVSLNGDTVKDISIAENATLSDINKFSDMSKYLSDAKYWEVYDESIQSKAEELKGDSENILEILQNNYKFIVDSIDYDEFKYGSINQRQGALATLNGGSSVCMEYSDLLITLSRAQGIPARAAYGYGYDPKVQPDEQEDHQWVQAWIPEYGWLTIDPTWGETGREFIGKDLDHALWYVASENPNSPSPLSVLSFSSDIELKSSIIEINAVEEIPENTDLKTLNEIIDEVTKDDTTVKQISRKIQTTVLGKAVIIVAPLTLFVLFIVFFISKIVQLFKGKPKNVVTPPPSA